MSLNSSKNIAGNTLDTDAHTTEPGSRLGDSSGVGFVSSSEGGLAYFFELELCATMLGEVKRRVLYHFD